MCSRAGGLARNAYRRRLALRVRGSRYPSCYWPGDRRLTLSRLRGIIFGSAGWAAGLQKSRCRMTFHRISHIKRKRKCGFLVRMRTKKGRQMINRKRRVGRKVSVA